MNKKLGLAFLQECYFCECVYACDLKDLVK